MSSIGVRGGCVATFFIYLFGYYRSPVQEFMPSKPFRIGNCRGALSLPIQAVLPSQTIRVDSAPPFLSY